MIPIRRISVAPGICRWSASEASVWDLESVDPIRLSFPLLGCCGALQRT